MRRRIGILAALLTLVALSGLAGATALPKPSSVHTSLPTLLQFRSQGHILGFAEDRMYTVGMGGALIEEFVGAHKVQPQAAEATSSTTPATPSSTGAPPLQTVTYPQLWDGITVSYTTTASGLAMSTYLVEPKADPRHIRLRYNTDVAVQPDGSLRVQQPNATGHFTLSAPIAWQERDGRRLPVSVAFTHPTAREVGFTVGAYDPTLPLLIDPTYGWYTSFYGSAGVDIGHAIAVDGSGNVYVTAGTRGDTWDGPGSEPPLHPHSGSNDLVVLKLDSAGAYQWHTFYGSADEDAGLGIAVDGSGNVYVTGVSAATWDGPSGEPPLHPHSGDDLVVLTLTSAGAYQWHTFYGSTDSDVGYDIAVDGSGNVYVTGYSIATWDGPSGEPPLHPHSGFHDLVVLTLTSTGAYQWHTFYGSAGYDEGPDIAVDGSGNVYVTGYSSATWGTPLHPHSGSTDLVVLKLDSAGAYQWHTFYGSTPGGDFGDGIAVDSSGNVYVTGNSGATWDGPSGEPPLHPHSGAGDLVVLKLTSAGAYQWHTFYGSATSADTGVGMAVDSSGNVYVTGNSGATWDGPSGEPPLHPHSGFHDLVVLTLTSTGAYQWHTFYGSTSFDMGSGIAVDGSGNVYVTGYSTATWGTPLQPHSGNYDIVVLKLADADTTPPDTTPPTPTSTAVLSARPTRPRRPSPSPGPTT